MPSQHNVIESFMWFSNRWRCLLVAIGQNCQPLILMPGIVHSFNCFSVTINELSSYVVVNASFLFRNQHLELHSGSVPTTYFSVYELYKIALLKSFPIPAEFIFPLNLQNNC